MAAGSTAYKTYVAKPGEVKPRWYLVDAAGQTLGRLAVPLAMKLMGKDKPVYTPHLDTGDFIVVVNAQKIKIDPRKARTKTYRHWSGYLGGLRIRTYAEVQAKKPHKIVSEAVRKMLPKTLLGKRMLSKLKVYGGADHPHTAQQPVEWKPLAEAGKA